MRNPLLRGSDDEIVSNGRVNFCHSAVPARPPCPDGKIAVLMSSGARVTANATELETALQAWLPRADAGDFVAMAYVALILHLSGRTSRGAANNWLRRAMVSDDPEFLINLGEELVIGTAIYRDLQAARDCFDRAQIRSELMGSYALARFTICNDRKQALECLERAAALDHVPSRQQLNWLLLPKRGLRRKLLALQYFPGLLTQMVRVSTGRAVRRNWWRYKDVFTGEEPGMDAELGPDRRYHFPWARPSTLVSFATVCAKGESLTLRRGAIDAAALTSHLFSERVP